MNWVALAIILLIGIVVNSVFGLVLQFIVNVRLRKANSELLALTDKLKFNLKISNAMFARSSEVVVELNKLMATKDEAIGVLNKRVEELEERTKAFDVPTDDDGPDHCEDCSLPAEDEEACRECDLYNDPNDEDVPPNHSER